mmetsp:Transcript_110683/g.220009  ORF Transcript_110683/g.220009 Transcript_110683/m.220009 type:complete len:249 (+) Transcript_110683:62-808(+)
MDALVASLPIQTQKGGFFADPSLWTEAGMKEVCETMLAVDRCFYCPPSERPYAHICPAIGVNSAGRVTISKPLVHAFFLHQCCQWLNKQGAEGDLVGTKVLDVGSGSGYLTAALARLLIRRGVAEFAVVGIDVTEELVNLGRCNLQNDESNASLPVTFRCEDAWQLCHPDDGEYGFIAVSAAAPCPQPPMALLQRLAICGLLICPVSTGQDDEQCFVAVTRTGPGIGTDNFTEPEVLCPAKFVPLVRN